MARNMKVATAQLGDIQLLRIQENPDGTWEEEWEPLRSTPLAKLVSRVSQQNLNHVLHGYSKPFVDSLGLPPEAALRKMPEKECQNRQRCTFYKKADCLATSKKLPWCFEPEGIEGPEKSSVAAQAVQRWKDKTYLVVVYEDTPR